MELYLTKERLYVIIILGKGVADTIGVYITVNTAISGFVIKRRDLSAIFA